MYKNSIITKKKKKKVVQNFKNTLEQNSYMQQKMFYYGSVYAQNLNKYLKTSNVTVKQIARSGRGGLCYSNNGFKRSNSMNLSITYFHDD